MSVFDGRGQLFVDIGVKRVMQDRAPFESIQLLHGRVNLVKVDHGHDGRTAGPQAVADLFQEIVVQAQMPDGRSQFLQVTALKPDAVTLDGNHPLAGKDLKFEVKVESFRPATEEEVKALVYPPHQECGDPSCNHEH